MIRNTRHYNSHSLVGHGYGAREKDEVLLRAVVEAELVELGVEATVVPHRVHDIALALLAVPVPAAGQQCRHVGLLVVIGGHLGVQFGELLRTF